MNFKEISEAKLKNFIKSVKIEDDAPDSKLVVKKGLLKREKVKLIKFQAATAVLTMDGFLYLFDWSLKKENRLSDPKLTINVNNIKKIEAKKGLTLVITEKKKSLFSQVVNHSIKAHTEEDLKDWLLLLTPKD